MIESDKKSENTRELESILKKSLDKDFLGQTNDLSKVGKSVHFISQTLIGSWISIADYKFMIKEESNSYQILTHVNSSLIFRGIVNKRVKKIMRNLHSRIKKESDIDINYPLTRVETTTTPYGFKSVLYLPKV